MVKLFSKSHTYEHSWGNVSSAFWRKYPNPLAPHVKEIDCISRSVDEHGQFISHRILTARAPVPDWVFALGVSPFVIGMERAVVNADTQSLIIQSCNVTGSSVMTVEETCIYEQHPDNKDHTLYTQEARVTSFLPWLAASSLEKHSISTFHTSSQQGLRSIECLCQQVEAEGISSLQSLKSTWEKFSAYLKDDSALPATAPSS